MFMLHVFDVFLPMLKCPWLESTLLADQVPLNCNPLLAQDLCWMKVGSYMGGIKTLIWWKKAGQNRGVGKQRGCRLTGSVCEGVLNAVLKT